MFHVQVYMAQHTVLAHDLDEFDQQRRQAHEYQGRFDILHGMAGKITLDEWVANHAGMNQTVESNAGS